MHYFSCTSVCKISSKFETRIFLVRRGSIGLLDHSIIHSAFIHLDHLLISSNLILLLVLLHFFWQHLPTSFSAFQWVFSLMSTLLVLFGVMDFDFSKSITIVLSILAFYFSLFLRCSVFEWVKSLVFSILQLYILYIKIFLRFSLSKTTSLLSLILLFAQISVPYATIGLIKVYSCVFKSLDRNRDPYNFACQIYKNDFSFFIFFNCF